MTDPTRALLLTIKQTTQLMNCSRRTVDRLAAKGLLKVVRLGRAVRITRASVEQLVARGGQP